MSEEAGCEGLLEVGHARKGRGVREVKVSESHDCNRSTLCIVSKYYEKEKVHRTPRWKGD